MSEFFTSSRSYITFVKTTNDKVCHVFNTITLQEELIKFDEYEARFNPSICLTPENICSVRPFNTLNEYIKEKDKIILYKKYEDFINCQACHDFIKKYGKKSAMSNNANIYLSFVNSCKQKYPIETFKY